MFQFFFRALANRRLRKYSKSREKKKSDLFRTIRNCLALSQSRCPPSNKRSVICFFAIARFIISSYIYMYIYYNRVVYLPGKLDRIARFPALWSIRGRDRFWSASSILIQCTNTRNTLNSKTSTCDICNEENGSSSRLETGCQEVSSNSSGYSLDRSPT